VDLIQQAAGQQAVTLNGLNVATYLWNSNSSSSNNNSSSNSSSGSSAQLLEVVNLKVS
jgi:hypothetical protein